MASVFIKVPVSERYPKNLHKSYYTNIGSVYGFYMKLHKAEWWLEEIELPTDEEMNKLKPLPDDSVVSAYDSGFYNGANFILNKLKGGL